MDFAKTGFIFVQYYDHQRVILITNKAGIYLYNIDLLSSRDFGSQTGSAPNPPESIIERVPSELNAELQNTRLSSADRSNQSGYFYLSTDKGIYCMNPEGRLVQIINKNMGLQNELVFDTFIDKDHNLWAGLNQGIAYIEIESPLTVFDKSGGIDQTVNGIKRYRGGLYAVTSSGLYLLPKHRTIIDVDFGFELIARGELFNLMNLNDHLLVKLRNTIYQVDDKKLVELAKDPNHSTDTAFGSRQTYRFPRHFFVGLYPADLMIIEDQKTQSNSAQPSIKLSETPLCIKERISMHPQPSTKPTKRPLYSNPLP